MSKRYNTWTNALSEITNCLSLYGISLKNESFDTEIEIINLYSRTKGITGTLPNKILAINRDFNSFKEFISRMPKS